MGTARAADPDVQMEFLEVVQKPTPNPAKTNENIQAQVKVHLKNAAGQEIQPPEGTVFDWSCTGVTKDAQAFANHNVQATDGQTTTMTCSFAADGDYVITLHVEVTNPAWPATFKLQDSVALSVKVQTIVVRFSPSAIKTGFVTVGDTVNTGKVTVTVTVLPALEVGNITLDVAGANRVSITDVSPRNTTTGTFTFVVKGVSATPSTSPDGDTTIEGRKNGIARGSAQVKVIVPASIQKPTPFFEGDITGVNAAVNGTTTPALYIGPGQPYPSNKVSLRTLWQTNQTITVLDQFGEVLDSLYDGALVYEDDPINQSISGGSYTDPVGPMMKKEPAPSAVDNDDSPLSDKTQWLASPTRIMPAPGAYPGSVPVQVGGHQVGSVSRLVTITLIPGSTTKIHMKIESTP